MVQAQVVLQHGSESDSDLSEDEGPPAGYQPLQSEESNQVPVLSERMEPSDCLQSRSPLDARSSSHIKRSALEARQGSHNSTEPSGRVDVGTLSATARALANGSQPVDFAGWGGAPLVGTTSGGHRSMSAASNQNQAPARIATTRTSLKVVVSAERCDPSEDAMPMTDEKKTAILGAMKNIRLDYMPQWATVVPEETWMGLLKTDSGAYTSP